MFKVHFIIGNVRDLDAIDAAMHGVDYVFSAAALKQVPACEFYPMQAVRTNIFGSENVLEAAVRNKEDRIVDRRRHLLSHRNAPFLFNTRLCGV